MLTAEFVRPLLLHEDPYVRTAAVEYFAESWSRDAGLVALILEARRRFGSPESDQSLALAHRLQLDDAELDQVLRLLDHTDDLETTFHLSRIVTRAPIELLPTHAIAIFKSDHLLEEARPTIQFRLELADWSGEQLWLELQDFSDHSDGVDSNEVDQVFGELLVEALARHSAPDAGTISDLLAEFEPQGGGWLETFLIDLAGRRGLTETIPQLVRRFRIDTDLMLERCSEALVRMRDPRAIHLIGETFSGEGWDFKNFATGVLANLKLPESEQVILELLEGERDVDIRTSLCQGLCALFSERGVPIVRQQIHAGYSDWMLPLEEALLPVIEALGIALPEAGQWKKERRAEERRFEARWRTPEGRAERLRELEELGLHSFAGRDAPIDRPVPFERSEPKIGRNTPCPCGSGQKYKRCCGKP